MFSLYHALHLGLYIQDLFITVFSFVYLRFALCTYADDLPMNLAGSLEDNEELEEDEDGPVNMINKLPQVMNLIANKPFKGINKDSRYVIS